MTGIPPIMPLFDCGLRLRRRVTVQGERKSLQVPPDFSIRSVDSTASPGSWVTQGLRGALLGRFERRNRVISSWYIGLRC